MIIDNNDNDNDNDNNKQTKESKNITKQAKEERLM